MKIKKMTGNMMLRLQLLCCLLLIITLNVAQGQLQFADLGDFPLQNGQVIKECKIGYRTFGQLNAQQSNAILFPTYYGGTSEHLISYLGVDQMLDTAKYFVIIVDAFGDGISSSPSNSAMQPGILFPEFSIKDMVEAQYQFVTKKLKLNHLYAITGISMGGLQTYQWMASYPDFFDKAAPIVGTPTMTAADLLALDIYRKILEMCPTGDCPKVTALALQYEYMVGFTPAFRMAHTTPDAYPDLLKEIEQEASNYYIHDLWSQMKAILHHNIAANYNNSIETVAKRFKGAVYITVATQDHMLSPMPSIQLAKLMNAELLELNTNCGHYAFACEKEKIGETVRNFLAKHEKF